MADKTYGTIVTDCGIQLIAAAVMEGKKINITDLAVGDGGGSYYKPNSTMTALKGEKWRGKVNRVEINEKSPNMIDVVAVIPSDVGGWTIREMGVLDETETLNVLTGRSPLGSTSAALPSGSTTRSTPCRSSLRPAVRRRWLRATAAVRSSAVTSPQRKRTWSTLISFIRTGRKPCPARSQISIPIIKTTSCPMVWNRRLFQNVSDCLLLFQFTENAESHGQHWQQHP